MHWKAIPDQKNSATTTASFWSYVLCSNRLLSTNTTKAKQTRRMFANFQHEQWLPRSDTMVCGSIPKGRKNKGRVDVAARLQPYVRTKFGKHGGCVGLVAAFFGQNWLYKFRLDNACESWLGPQVCPPIHFRDNKILAPIGNLKHQRFTQ